MIPSGFVILRINKRNSVFLADALGRAFPGIGIYVVSTISAAVGFIKKDPELVFFIEPSLWNPFCREGRQSLSDIYRIFFLLEGSFCEIFYGKKALESTIRLPVGQQFLHTKISTAPGAGPASACDFCLIKMGSRYHLVKFVELIQVTTFIDYVEVNTAHGSYTINGQVRAFLRQLPILMVLQQPGIYIPASD